MDLKERFISSFSPKDLLAGVIVALVSIPISMGYAQIAGLPMVYGLYGSLLPIFFFGLITTSKDYVFGVDAAPAALTGAALAAAGITAESEQALQVVPMIALITALWLLVFYFAKAGKLVKYISMPVMGGFVTGICLEIMLMQVPKLYGGTPGTGELFELLANIVKTAMSSFNLASFILGAAAVAVILISKKFIPKFPMTVAVMLAGAALAKFAHIENLGIALLPDVPSGLPKLVLPGMAGCSFSDLFFSSLTIALVITSETLLASSGFAMADGYKLNNNREILAYAVGNIASAAVGCCPTNGSVSRTGIVRQFGCSSQWMSISAAVSMVLILLFGTGFIKYLPVPVLCAIVLTALYGACEFDIARKLFKTSRFEFYIYIAALMGVLLFGTIYGVMIGVILSFVEVVMRAVAPPKTLMGVIPGKIGFYDLDRNKDARPIEHVVLYRFGGNLFFANIDTFQEDIEAAIQTDTTTVIVNAGAVGNVDITAAERLLAIYHTLKEKNIRFYFVEHVGAVNDQLKNYGSGELISSGAVRMTTQLALRDAGYTPPYNLESREHENVALKRVFNVIRSFGANDSTQAELEWAFGDSSDQVKEKMTEEMIENSSSRKGQIPLDHLVEELEKNSFGKINLFDEDEFLDRLEMNLGILSEKTGFTRTEIEDAIEKRRAEIESELDRKDPESLRRLRMRRERQSERFRRQNQEAYEHIRQRRREHIERLEEKDPELAEKFRKLYRLDETEASENGKNKTE